MSNVPERSFNLIREIMKKPKTLFLFINYEGGEEHTFFFEREGDYSHLNNTCINAGEDGDKEDELLDLMGEDLEFGDGSISPGFALHIDKLKEPTKDWDYFVMCGIV